ncbi:Uma2 family endonuclease [Nostoc sp. UCD121]|uniref:Uma2 family endonuclease n=1 Tax=unclassified Nostoc TaxID=2593658 RepID=UPI001627A6DA|nr:MULTISPECIES: Uma2 family endonuclease [unclassified Nostoc]MBC1223213.1 Uma2 family endonuclease [Nostoc sp. UCD120]MBC1279121.1 Uma2 family endonuclease [Nostoc sp. UCD121]MBC1299533.1 Uma2 family endonuclease [Nostoc sp. UCD122]
MNAVTTTLPSTLKLKIDLTDDQFFEMCQKNRDYRFERTASGELLIMPPTGSDTGNRNFDMVVELGIWNKQTKLGKGFDSSTGFTLPNGSERSPDLSWVKIERWNALAPEQQEKFAPICPDFVVELRSRTDSLKDLQEKMQEYIENGAQLGWLIDRKNKRVEIYRPGKDVEILDNPASLSGENILPGFVLNLQQIL